MIPPPREVLATKVCDSSGEPLVVYHGTCRTFTTFSSEYLLSVGTHFGCLEQANYRIGFYDIQYFGAKTQYTCDMQGCRIIPAYLIIKKLIDLRGHDFGWERPAATAYLLTQSGLISAEEASACTGLKETDTLPTAWWIETTPDQMKNQYAALTDILSAKGFDGILYANTNEPRDKKQRDAYLVFRPQQIYSALTGQCVGE
jgi:hypothetical protein